MIHQTVTCDRCGEPCGQRYYTIKLETHILDPVIRELQEDVLRTFPKKNINQRQYCNKCRREIEKIIYADTVRSKANDIPKGEY